MQHGNAIIITTTIIIYYYFVFAIYAMIVSSSRPKINSNK